MILSLSGTFMDTMSSGSSNAGIPNSRSATSKARRLFSKTFSFDNDSKSMRSGR